MLGLNLKIYDFCATVIKSAIVDGGFSYKKPATRTVLFYSGPTQEVLDQIPEAKSRWTAHLYPLNWKLAAHEASRLNAMRVDDTKLFPSLRHGFLAEAMDKHFAKANDDEMDMVKGRVWDYVSAYYSRTAFRKAATMVCGAGENSSFYKEEMYGMLENPTVELVNEKPVDLFRDLKTLGKDEVHRAMCLTALMEMRSYAHRTGDKDAWQNYKRQRKYFVLARKPQKKTFAKQPVNVRDAFKETRKEVLQKHGMTGPKRTAKVYRMSPPIKLAS